MLQVLRALAAMVVAGSIFFGLLFPGTALAHERRKLGKYELVVGFLEEPAFLGQPNAVSLAVKNTETNQPVERLQQTLDGEISSEGKSKAVQLRARFGVPGAYVADFIPTRMGTYIFRFFGEIEGLKVDERFQSGPSTFSDVQGVEELQFPEKLPDGLELAARLEKAESAAQDARNMAIFVGGVALAFGVAGAALGLIALSHKGQADN